MPKCNTTLEERFWSKVDKSGTAEHPFCWTWKAYRNACGYGMVKAPDRVHLAHRLSYAFTHGAVPGGTEIDHLCANRACVNPAHLEAVPHRENIRRSAARTKPKTHCKHGHAFTPENTYVDAKRHKRACKTCQARIRAEWVARGGLVAWKARRAAA